MILLNWMPSQEENPLPEFLEEGDKPNTYWVLDPITPKELAVLQSLGGEPEILREEEEAISFSSTRDFAHYLREIFGLENETVPEIESAIPDDGFVPGKFVNPDKLLKIKTFVWAEITGTEYPWLA